MKQAIIEGLAVFGGCVIAAMLIGLIFMALDELWTTSVNFWAGQRARDAAYRRGYDAGYKKGIEDKG